ncbi:MAG: hypothetical protein ACI9KI_002027, partial [Patiriisocius sp.]
VFVALQAFNTTAMVISVMYFIVLKFQKVNIQSL